MKSAGIIGNPAVGRGDEVQAGHRRIDEVTTSRMTKLITEPPAVTHPFVVGQQLGGAGVGDQDRVRHRRGGGVAVAGVDEGGDIVGGEHLERLGIRLGGRAERGEDERDDERAVRTGHGGLLEVSGGRSEGRG